MEQATEKIINIITTTVHPNNVVNLDLSETGVTSILATTAQELEKIRLQLINTVFKVNSQIEIERLIQSYQSLFITLLDDLYYYQLNNEENKNLLQLYTAITRIVSDLLLYIQKYFSKYFNVDENIPFCYLSISNNNFKEHWDTLKLRLTEKSVDQKLIEIIAACYSFPETPKYKNDITYHQLIYLSQFLSELNLRLSDQNRSDINIDIRNLLIYLNFNHPAFISYVTEKLTENTSFEETSQEKLVTLSFYRKNINQINCRVGLGLNKGMMTAKEQIILWLEEEIDFLKNERSPVLNATSVSDTNEDDAKINTSLSIPQLACLIRLFVDSKTITNANQTQILKFFSTHFTSLKRENISYGHLRSQYYKVELPALENIKALLVSMINGSRRLR